MSNDKIFKKPLGGFITSTIKKTPVALAIGAALTVGISTQVVADDNLFGMNDLATGYMVTDAAKNEGEGKCGEGKCGGDDEKKDDGKKDGEGKCGEGKCGGDDEKKDDGKKDGEGKCGS